MDNSTLLPLPSPDEVLGTDAEKSRSIKSILRPLMTGVVGFSLALAFGYMAGNLFSSDVSWGLATWQRFVFFFAIILPIPLILAIHEGGHLLGGKIAGFTFSLFVVGPLMVMRRKQGVKISLNKSLALFGGLAASYPKDTHNLRRRLMWMVAGGPAASIISGALLIAIRYIFWPDAAHPDTHSVFDLYIRAELLILGFGSIVIGFITLFPGKTSGFLTDGARIRILLQGGPQGDREKASWLITSQSLAGTRPRDWDAETINDALALQDESPFEYVMRNYAFYNAIDRQDAAQARQHIARTLDIWHHLPPTIRPNLAREAAFFEAACRNDAPAARAWLDATPKGPFVDEAANLRSEAAVLFAEGRVKEAQQAAAGIEQAVAQSLDVGTAMAQQEWIANMLASSGRLASN